mmetsp:Transcript_9729/g.32429  ORF Transcript_9729/g.32429 Transcript_9729/m.32429 type:complete len:221 (+) Transcript_9729:124-786(+)
MDCPPRAITWTHQQAPAAPWSRAVVHTCATICAAQQLLGASGHDTVHRLHHRLEPLGRLEPRVAQHEQCREAALLLLEHGRRRREPLCAAAHAQRLRPRRRREGGRRGEGEELPLRLLLALHAPARRHRSEQALARRRVLPCGAQHAAPPLHERLEAEPRLLAAVADLMSPLHARLAPCRLRHSGALTSLGEPLLHLPHRGVQLSQLGRRRVILCSLLDR